MTNRENILIYVKEKYNVVPEYPWMRTPNYAVLRQRNNRKWFGAIIDITEDKLGFDGNRLVDVLNLKIDPLLVGALRDMTCIFPAYHMNKEHWISVLLCSSITEEQVFQLIDMSYGLTK